MKHVYQHFRPEERDFIDQVTSWKQQVEEQYAPKRTDFLDPRQRQIMEAVVGQGDVKVAFWGGWPNAERQRALLYPSYFEPSEAEFGLQLYGVKYPQKFAVIRHPQLLGSLMGLGLKREKFGDILQKDASFQLILAEEVSAYVEANFTHIGKTAVTIEPLSFENVIIPKEEWHHSSVTVSSLRLDAVVAALPGMSRQKAQDAIKGGAVKLNWQPAEAVAAECEEGDMLSVRGIGRIKLQSIDGQTKKDKWRITLGILK